MKIPEYTYKQLVKDYHSVAARVAAVKGCIVTIQKLSEYRPLGWNEDDCWYINRTFCNANNQPVELGNASLSPVIADSIDMQLSKLMNGRKEVLFNPDQATGMNAANTASKMYEKLYEVVFKTVDAATTREINVRLLKTYRKNSGTTVIVCRADKMLDMQRQKRSDLMIFPDDYIIGEYDPVTQLLVQAEVVKLDAKLTDLLNKNNGMLLIED